jgi:ATP/maltotriose-dependent transcriptional regulator MalT
METLREEPHGRAAAAAASIPVVGREEPLLGLADALAAARSGHPNVVSVEGPAGSGKTALVRRFAGEHDDLALLWASGDASEQSVPLALVDQLLRRATAGESPALVATADPAQFTAVALTLLEVLGELQERSPVLLVIDDAQWADPDSLRALLFAIRRLVSEAILVILITRTDDLYALPDGLLRDTESLRRSRISLGPLDFGAVRTLAHRRSLPLSAHALRRVYELSAGLPLHLCALLDECSVTGNFESITAPPSYTALIHGHLSQCGVRAQRLIEAAAVLGRRASIEDVARVAGVDAPLSALEEATEQDLIRVSQRSIEFVHPLIRSAVYDGLGPARRAELHCAAAERAEDSSAALLHRAHAAAAPDQQLADELDAVARQAGAGGNWLRAAEFLTEAAELSTARADRERRILEAVAAHIEAGDYITAHAMVPHIQDFGLSAEREFVLGRIALSRLDVQTAEQHYRNAWRSRPNDNPGLCQQIASQCGYAAYFRLDVRSDLEWAERAMELTRAAGVPSRPAVPRLANALAMNGRLDEGLALMDQALAAPPGEPLDPIPLTSVRGRLRIVNDDLPGARLDLTKVTSTTVQGRSLRAAIALGRLSLLEYLTGAWDLALAHADQGLAACAGLTEDAQLPALRAPTVLVLAGRGAWREADDHLRAMRQESSDVNLLVVWAAFADAHLATAKGDAAAVVAALAPVLGLELRDAVDEPGFWPWQGLYADALVDLKRLDEADHFLAPHEARARERDRRSMIGRLARARGRLEAARGNHDAAQREFLLAAESLGELSMPYELALTELTHGQFLRRRRQRRAAVEVLANARDRFTAMGALPALERCERELEASGLSPKRPTGKGPGQLTPREMTVSRLVIEGLTNREIARELMVSVKTVEVQLTSIYGKLDVASRAELRARARSGDLETSKA